MVFSFYTILIILLVHFLADFGLQTDQQAKKKSTDIAFLAYHVSTYSLVWFGVTWAMYTNAVYALLFSLITFIAHYITDYFTSRIGKPFWEAGNTHFGFVVIGADQILHYIQLLLTHHLIVSLHV